MGNSHKQHHQHSKPKNNLEKGIFLKYTDNEVLVLKQIFNNIKFKGKDPQSIHQNQTEKGSEPIIRITEEEFMNFFDIGYIPNELLKKLFEKWIKGEYADEEKDKLNFSNFAEGIYNCCKQSNYSTYLEFYLSLFFEEKDTNISNQRIQELFELSAAMFFNFFHKKEKEKDQVTPLNQEEIKYLSQIVEYFYSTRSKDYELSLRELIRWIEKKTPQLGCHLVKKHFHFRNKKRQKKINLI